MHAPWISRRKFGATTTAVLASGLLPRPSAGTQSKGFRLKYILGSCMYGYQDLGEILPEVRKTGASAIDIWPKVHGNQREQLTDLGEDKFAAMLKQHDITLGKIVQDGLREAQLTDVRSCSEKINGRLPAPWHRCNMNISSL